MISVNKEFQNIPCVWCISLEDAIVFCSPKHQHCRCSHYLHEFWANSTGWVGGGGACNYFSVSTILIQLVAVSCRDKKFRAVASPVVLSVNVFRGIWMDPKRTQYAICIVFIARLYNKAPTIDFWEAGNHGDNPFKIH